MVQSHSSSPDPAIKRDEAEEIIEEIASETIRKNSTQVEHPIQRLPSELLQNIFEAATPNSQDGFKQATIISHVSRDWRFLALATPTLWAYIECSLLRPVTALAAFWERMCQRVKDIPVFIYILDIGLEPGDHRLQCCPLDKLSRIHSLTLEGEEETFLQEIQSPYFVPPPHSFNILSIHTKSNYPVEYWDATILDRFPPFHQLSLRGFHHSLPFHHTRIPLQALRLLGVSMPMDSFLGQYRNLSYLELDDHSFAWFKDFIPPSFTVPGLTTLKAYKASRWIGFISCPGITTFIIDDIRSKEWFIIIAWIEAHPSIVTLHVKGLEDYEGLAAAAPQLLHLRVEALQRFAPLRSDVISREFRNLRRLEIVDSYNVVSCEEFEELVRAGCLPADRESKSAGFDSIPLVLRVLIRPEGRRQECWKSTGLYQMARKTVMYKDDGAWFTGGDTDCKIWEVLDLSWV